MRSLFFWLSQGAHDDLEYGAAALALAAGRAPAVKAGDPSNEGEPEPDPRLRRLRRPGSAVERFEDAFAFFGRDAGTAVADTQNRSG